MNVNLISLIEAKPPPYAANDKLCNVSMATPRPLKRPFIPPPFLEGTPRTCVAQHKASKLTTHGYNPTALAHNGRRLDARNT